MQDSQNNKITSADMASAFTYLLESGFEISGQVTTPEKAAVGFKGNEINIRLFFEYREGNFDFSVINSHNSAIHKPIWRILKHFDADLNLADLTPKDLNDKQTLNFIAQKFKVVLQSIKDDPGVLTQI